MAEKSKKPLLDEHDKRSLILLLYSFGVSLVFFLVALFILFFAKQYF